MTFRSSSGLSGASSATAAVPVPTGAASGDIAVVGLYKENTAVVTAPAGFTEKVALTTSGATRGTLYVYWKRLTAADSGTYDFSWTGATFRAAAAGLWSGRVASGDPFDGTVGTAEDATGTATTLNVSTSPATANGDAVGFWTDFTGGNTWTAPTNYTERQDLDVITLDTRDAVASGSTGNVTATANVAGFLKAFLGVLKIAGGLSVTVGIALETEFPSALGRLKSRAAGISLETETAMPIGRLKSRALGITLETDAAVMIARGGTTHPVPIALEIDQPQPIGRQKIKALGTAFETDSALLVRRPMKIVKFPTYKERLGDPRLLNRYTLKEPVSLLKKNGVWTEVVSPHQDEIAAAEGYYQGGMRYVLTEAQAADLPPQYVEVIL